MPAVSLAAVPTKRQRSIDLIAQFEERGFSGIYCPSFGDPIALCQAIAERTNEIRFGTSILPIYFRQPNDLAAAASFLHELSGGRFDLGLGVSHGPTHSRLGITVGKPLADTRDYVQALRDAEKMAGPLPPIVLATLRDKMVQLSVEISEGAVWANASRSRMAHSISLMADVHTEFFVGNMIPTVISDDREAAAAVNRKTLSGYVALPNYRNYWKSAGYVEEMEACETAIANGNREALATAMSDSWLSDATLYGTASEVRDGVEAWFDAGVTTPIIVPSATDGGQLRAVELLFEAYS
jgi:alkanesulfonate monooxygenase SsuD/methylene tetrahydromethanopterin reductase-like flavin-dependent oxidoreductase (luciferase family)